MILKKFLHLKLRLRRKSPCPKDPRTCTKLVTTAGGSFARTHSTGTWSSARRRAPGCPPRRSRMLSRRRNFSRGLATIQRKLKTVRMCGNNHNKYSNGSLIFQVVEGALQARPGKIVWVSTQTARFMKERLSTNIVFPVSLISEYSLPQWNMSGRNTPSYSNTYHNDAGNLR